jgi:hypothetical protein
VIDIGCISFRADARECLPVAHPQLSTRQRQLAAPHQPHIGNRVMRGATRAQRGHGRVAAGQAGDAGEACDGDGLGEGHRRQDGGEPPGQPGLARPGGRAGCLSPHPRCHDRDTACGCRAGSGTCLTGTSRSGSDAIGPQIESRCSGPIAGPRTVRLSPCSMRIDPKADPTRLTATARLLLCTRSGRRPQRPSDRPQHHSQAGLGQEQP